MEEKPDLLPALAAGKGRLFIYRDVQAGGINVDTVRPEILIGQKPIGASVAGGVYVRDLPPGEYRVELRPPSFGDMIMSGNYTVGGGVTVPIREGSHEYVKISATRFSMACTVGCAATTNFSVNLVLTSVGRTEVFQRVLLNIASD